MKRKNHCSRLLTACFAISMTVFAAFSQVPSALAADAFFSGVPSCEDGVLPADGKPEDAAFSEAPDAPSSNGPEADALSSAFFSSEEALEKDGFTDTGSLQDGFYSGEAEAGFTDGAKAAFGIGGAAEEEPSDGSEPDESDTLFPYETLSRVLAFPDPDMGEEGTPTSMVGATFAEAYDNRAYATPVRNQFPYGMCWAFTTTASMETYLRMKGEGIFDFSEEHLAYFFSHRENDPLGNTPLDHNVFKDSDEYAYRTGGNQIMTALFLSTWSGLADESLVPYPTDEKHAQRLPTSATPDMAYQTTGFLSDAAISSYSETNMKNLVKAYGSVGVSLMMNEARYFNNETFAYSNPVKASPTHAVTVVGWDDHYSKDNFLPASEVTSDGAWIAKNSWGEDWGDNGYFYISYECKSLINLVAISGTTKPAYPNNYFYDGTSAFLKHLPLAPSGEGNAAFDSVANIFQVKAGGQMAESLGEVVLADYSANADYEVQVYTNLTDLANPASGVPAFAAPVSVRKPYPGIRTVRLPSEVVLAPGTYYSVVITNTGANPVRFLVEETGVIPEGWLGFTCGIESSQSFIGNGNSTWRDLIDYDSFSCCARIKAHTRTLSEPVSLSLSVLSDQITAGDSVMLLSEMNPALAGGFRFSYTSSDPAKAVVSDGGILHALKSGTVTVTCQAQGIGTQSLTASCRIRIDPLPKPELSALGISYRRIRLSWNQLAGIDGYFLYRSINGGSLKRIASLTPETVSYDDTKAKLGVKYRYRVRAYRLTMDGSRVAYGPLSAFAPASAAALDTPILQYAKPLSGRKIRIVWKNVSGAGSYAVYRRTGTKGSYLRIATVRSGRIYTDHKLTKGIKYYYKVRAIRTVDGKNYYSGYSKAKSAIAY